MKNRRQTNLLGGIVVLIGFILLLAAMKLALHIGNPTLNLGLLGGIAVPAIGLMVSIVLYFVKPSL